ncbi:MAG: peptide-methionine (S)-S-oxide reductase MsrA [Nevskiales bacterium]
MEPACDIPGIGLKDRSSQFPDPKQDITPEASQTEQTAVLAAGCFWCVEAVFTELDGVLKVSSGYTGGSSAQANYEAVCGGSTEHAEAVWIRFDPARISFGQLLKVFFSVAHDPTQLNRQGNDRGTQYRSAIFYADEAQRAVAAAYIQQLDAAGVFKASIATRLEPLNGFYDAEAYHQNYAERNPDQPYIEMISTPKVEKLRKYFGERLKSRRG